MLQLGRFAEALGRFERADRIGPAIQAAGSGWARWGACNRAADRDCPLHLKALLISTILKSNLLLYLA